MRVGAEFAGSFFVIFITLIVTGLLGPANNQIPGLMAIVAALTLAAAYGIAAIVFGKVSGGQINPAVTFAAALTARISWLDALLYIIAQLLGEVMQAPAIAVFMAPTPITNTGFSSVGFIAHMANLYDQGTQQFLSLPTVYSNLTTFDMRWTIVLEVIAALRSSQLIWQHQTVMALLHVNTVWLWQWLMALGPWLHTRSTMLALTLPVLQASLFLPR